MTWDGMHIFEFWALGRSLAVTRGLCKINYNFWTLRLVRALESEFLELIVTLSDVCIRLLSEKTARIPLPNVSWDLVAK
jgi:hypothetical protein